MMRRAWLLLCAATVVLGSEHAFHDEAFVRAVVSTEYTTFERYASVECTTSGPTYTEGNRLTTAQLVSPTTTIPLPDGRVVIGSENQHILSVVSNADDVTVSTLAGISASNVGTDGTGTSAGLGTLTALAYNYYTGLLFAMTKYSLRTIDPTSLVVTTIAGSFNSGGATVDHTTGTSARFHGLVYGMAFTKACAYLMIADHDGHRIRSYRMATSEVDTVIGDGTPGHIDGWPTTPARLNGPKNIASTWSGDFVIAEDTGNYVRYFSFSTTKVVSTLACDGSSSTSGNIIGPAGSVRCLSPAAIVAFASSWNTTIVIFSSTAGTELPLRRIQIGYVTRIKGGNVPVFHLSFDRFSRPWENLAAHHALLYVPKMSYN